MAQLFSTYGDDLKRQMRVAMPARVVKYDPATQLADVQPVIKETLPGLDALDLPLIQKVPVQFPRTHTAFITLPIQTGDMVLLVFLDRSMDKWLHSKSSEQVNPLDPRRHDINDCVAFPCGYPLGSAIPAGAAVNAEDILIGRLEGETVKAIVRVKEDGSINLETTSVIRLGSGASAKASVTHPELSLFLLDFLTACEDLCSTLMAAVAPSGADAFDAPTIAKILISKLDFVNFEANRNTFAQPKVKLD